MEVLFKKASNQAGFLKMGMQGFSGSGKSFTASLIAIGLYKYIKAKKPVAFLDTENGSDFVLPMFTENKVELLVSKSRAFIDLVAGVDEAEKNCSILIIDSVSHYWEEFLQAYQNKKGINRIILRDWMFLKAEWKKFLTRYLTSNIHIIMCGRAKFMWGYLEVDGEKELAQVGTQMKVEGETAFEPSLLVEMRREYPATGNIEFKHRAWVIKDRSNRINGKYFDSPNFDSFLPHIESLNLKGEHFAVDTKRGSEAMFQEDRNLSEYYKERDILLENLKDELDLKGLSGRSDEIQKKRIEVLRDAFGTSSKTEIEGLKLEDIKKGLEKVKKYNPIEPEKKEEKPKHPAELWREILTLKGKITDKEWNNILTQHFTGKKEAVDFTEPQIKTLRTILENHIKEEQKDGGGKRNKREK